jgi:Tol biopolymer transport system component
LLVLPEPFRRLILVLLLVAGCTAPSTTTATTTTTIVTTTATTSTTATTVATTTAPPRTEGSGVTPVLIGEPIDLATLRGRIVFDDFEDLFTVDVGGTGLFRLTTQPGSEFDGSWSPDGSMIVYRDSRRGINEDDEIYVISADGSGARNLTQDPSNDWGPEWSADGEWIVFNSDRDGHPMGGYLMRPDGTDVRRIESDTWIEYPSLSPDGDRLVFMGHSGGNYEIYVADIATGETTALTDSPGSDGWPVWSPDGEWIAFVTERDDCLHAAPDADCWRTDESGEHHSTWRMRPDGSEQQRVTPEYGHFVAWSPDSAHLLISGRTLYIVRVDGTGRVEVDPEGLSLPPGGIPDWGG